LVQETVIVELTIHGMKNNALEQAERVTAGQWNECS
jgi:hypothetical protein